MSPPPAQMRHHAPCETGRGRLLALSAGAWLVWVAGCQTTGAPVSEDRGMSADAALEQLALAEDETSDGPLAAVPPPPGVDPDLLAPSDAAIARVSLAEVLRSIEPFVFEAPAEMRPRADSIEPARRDQAVRHYLRGREAALDGDYFEASTELEQAHALDPASVAILRQLGRIYMAQNNLPKAADRYARLLAIESDDAESLLLIALGTVERPDYQTGLRMLAPLHGLTAMEMGDAGARVLVRHALWDCLSHLGYDRAAAEAATQALGLVDEITPQTRFTNRLGMIYRQRSDLWRAIGDARCRLGEVSAARASYAEALATPGVDPGSLPPRLIYTNLILGRPRTAQMTLLRTLQENPEQVSAREVSLAEYVARFSGPADELAASVRELAAAHPDSSGLVRTAAVLIDPLEAEALLRGFLQRRPSDMSVAAQTLGWIGERDLSRAMHFIATLVDAHPSFADEYVRLIVTALPAPGNALAELERMPSERGRDAVLARLYLELGGYGEAWQVASAARTRRPGEADPVLMQMKLAAALQEPKLLDQVVASARSIDSADAWILRSQAFRAVTRTEAALQACRTAIERAPENALAQIELARCYAAVHGEATSADARLEAARAIADAAERALTLEPNHEEAFAILAEVYGPNGPLSDRARFADVARRIYAANPESRLYARLAAREAAGQQRWSAVVERMLPLYESDHSDLEAFGLLLNAWLRQNRTDDAEAAVKRWMDERPGDPHLIEAWVQLLNFQNRNDEATTFLRSRYEAEPDNPSIRNLLETALRQAGDLEAALPLGELRLVSRPSGVRGELELAALYAGAGRAARAMPHVRWLVDRLVETTLDHCASLQSLLRRIDDLSYASEVAALALRVSEYALAKYPDAPLQIYGGAMVARLDDGASLDEIEALARTASRRSAGALDSTGPIANAWRNVAQTLVDAQYPAAAARVMRTRLTEDPFPSPQVATVFLQNLFAADAASLGSADEAIRLLHELDSAGRVPSSLGASLSEVLYQASLIYALVGADEATEGLLVEAIRLDPLNAVALNNLGYMRIEAGRQDPDSVGYIERAHRLDPDQGYILDTIGWLRYKQGRLSTEDQRPGAVELIESSIDAGDPSPEVLDHMGDALWRVGETDRAVDHWRRALGQLRNPQHRENVTRNYLLLQTQQWGLLVADPATLYDRDFSDRRRRLERKLSAAESDLDPPVAPQFPAEVSAVDQRD